MAEEATSTTTPEEGGNRSFTQEDVDRVVGERLAREREKYADYEDLRAKATQFDELAESQKSETQRLVEERDSLQGETQDLRTRVLRYEVAAEKGLDLELAELLTGATKEDMAAKADVLLERLKPKTDPGSYDGGARETPKPADMNSWMRAHARRG